MGFDPHGSNVGLVDPRTDVVLRSPTNRLGAPTAPSRSAEDGSSKTDAPDLGSQAVDEGIKSVGNDDRNDASALDSQAVDEGARSVGNKDGNDVLEISDSSVSNPEDNQGQESNRDDGGEEVDKERGGEMIGSEAHPLDNPPKIREGEATARVEDVDADQLMNVDLSEPSFGGGNIAQEHAKDPAE